MMAFLLAGLGVRAGLHGTYTGMLEAARENGVPSFVSAWSLGGFAQQHLSGPWSWRAMPGYLRTAITVQGTDISIQEFYLAAGPCYQAGNFYLGGNISVAGLSMVIQQINESVEAPRYGGFGAEFFVGKRLFGPLAAELSLSTSFMPVKKSTGPTSSTQSLYGFGFAGVEMILSTP